jgi:hypothetical protein
MITIVELSPSTEKCQRAREKISRLFPDESMRSLIVQSRRRSPVKQLYGNLKENHQPILVNVRTEIY